MASAVVVFGVLPPSVVVLWQSPRWGLGTEPPLSDDILALHDHIRELIFTLITHHTTQLN